jgi:hypothetical protein
MEPLDPELRRLVHEGMVQAVPSQAVEDRVLLGLLARLPPGGPPGADGSTPAREGTVPQPRGGGGEGALAASKAGAAAGSKPWLWVVLATTTVAGGVALGARREPEQAPAVAQTPSPSTRAHPAATRPAEPSESPAAPDVEPGSTPSAPGGAVAPASSSSLGTATRERPSASRRRAGQAERDTAGAEAAPVLDPPAPTTATAPDALAAEVQQVAAADRALVRGDARRARQLAREHAVAYPHGQLGLEREAIEHAARCLLAEPGAAAAAAAFLRAHPEAPAAAKVRARCAAPR